MSETPVAATVAPKVKRSRFVSRVVDGAGGNILFIAEERKSGNFITFAKHEYRDATTKKVVKEKSKGRGATSEHTSFEDAKKAAQAGITAATKAGWQLRATGGGGQVKDSFDLNSLPKPGKK